MTRAQQLGILVVFSLLLVYTLLRVYWFVP